MVQNLLVTFLLFTSTCSIAQKPNLYLQNNLNQKVRKIQLDKLSYLTYNADSTGLTCNHYRYYDSYDPSSAIFDSAGMTLMVHQYYSDRTCSYDSLNRSESSDVTYDWNHFVNFPYTSASPNVSIYLSYQKPWRAGFQISGSIVTLASMINALFVAPFIATNNGSFQNYNWSRFWRYELYSLAGMGVGIPLILCFQERKIYLQTNGSFHPTWSVVQP